ncbi:MAG: hypothetical protein CL462_10320 [Acidimicrobiaceae bacterium]|nr:hypothetical protein [Acidimicrobiaceae bacterium]
MDRRHFLEVRDMMGLKSDAHLPDAISCAYDRYIAWCSALGKDISSLTREDWITVMCSSGCMPDERKYVAVVEEETSLAMPPPLEAEEVLVG